MGEDNRRTNLKKPQIPISGGSWAAAHERVMAEMERARQERMKSRGYKRKKGDMKKYILMAALVLGAGTARAQDITASGINIKDLVDHTRAGVALPLAGGKTFQAIYGPLFTIHSADKMVVYASFNIGAAAYSGETKGNVVAFPAVRLDTLVDKVTGVSKWFKAHVTAAKLPQLEMGVGGLLFRKQVIPVANFSVLF